jgi:hypothetical protein
VGGSGSGRLSQTRSRPAQTADVIAGKLRVSMQQLRAIRVRRAEKKKFILFGGSVRCGKSWAAAIDAALAGIYDYPGDTFVLARKDKTNLLPQMWQFLKQVIYSIIPEKYIVVDRVSPVPQISVQLLVKGEVKVTTWLGFDTKRFERLMGFSIRGFYLDEGHEIDLEWVKKMGTRFSHRPGERGYHYYFITANPAPGWLREDFIVDQKPDHIFIPARIYDNPFIDQEGTIREIIGSIGANSFDFKRYVLGSWEVLEGQIYPMFDSAVHVHEFEFTNLGPLSFCQPMDWGLREPSCILWMAMDHRGHVYIRKEFYQAGVDVPYIADTYFRNCNALDIPQNERMVPIDPLSKEANKDGHSAFQQLAELGMPVFSADKTLHVGIGHIRGLFEKGMIHIHPECVRLLGELPNYVWDDQSSALSMRRNLPERPRKKDDHAMDTMRYGVNFLRKTAKVIEMAHPDQVNVDEILQKMGYGKRVA